MPGFDDNLLDTTLGSESTKDRIDKLGFGETKISVL